MDEANTGVNAQDGTGTPEEGGQPTGGENGGENAA